MAYSFRFDGRPRPRRPAAFLASDVSAASRSARMRSQQHRRRLIARVLRHKLALEGALENALPQPLRSLEAGLYRRLCLLHHGQPALCLSDNAVLLYQGRKGDPVFPYICQGKPLMAST